MLPIINQCSEWHRVHQLPVRTVDPVFITEAQRVLTNALRTPNGTMSLLYDQALALVEWAKNGALAGLLPVGAGKTLIAALAPCFFPGVAVLLVPAELRAKTLAELEEYRQHWRIPTTLRVLSYESIQTIRGATVLQEIAPRIVICDEAQALRRIGAARTRRFVRYVGEHAPRLMLLSGSLARRSIMDYHHLFALCFGGQSPLPMSRTTAEHWAAALDAGVNDTQRVFPGALLRWCLPTERCQPPLVAGRIGYRRRLEATPGVLLNAKTPVNASLTVSQRPLQVPMGITEAIQGILSTWETPNGDILQYAPDVHRHIKELLCGFWYRWDPAPPEDWLEARRDWHRFVRGILAQQRHDIDSPKQVENAFPSHPALRAWQRVMDTYTINQVPVWVDDFLVNNAANWLQKEGIAWVSHIAVGQRLSKVTGLRYFGGGNDASRDILTVRGSIIASVSAHKTGKNLQRYHRNLILSPPSSGDAWEQLLGRTHRLGQTATNVEAEVYLHHQVLARSMHRALEDAQFLQETSGAPQRLLRAQKNLPALDTE